MDFITVLSVFLSLCSLACSNPMHHSDGLFERYGPWNMNYRQEERPPILVERWEEEPQLIGRAVIMNGSTESTSTEQFTTITTLFYG
ncbi:hypothetical protein AVEN_194492-1 [Araneus ventricosus]|uniref:Peptidase M12A domain-containing protein n=1 Tax=Araneus ventricosus TaxID=182803 RepID=A0A4Y2A8L2_ARAVE|nr:hypothetical protein AVEN_194492-1 [Araneus ventricosus]